MKASKEEYIRYRIEKAWKTFEDAKLLAKTGYLIFGDYLNNFSQLLNSLTLFYEINEYNYHFKDYDSC